MCAMSYWEVSCTFIGSTLNTGTICSLKVVEDKLDIEIELRI